MNDPREPQGSGCGILVLLLCLAMLLGFGALGFYFLRSRAMAVRMEAERAMMIAEEQRLANEMALRAADESRDELAAKKAGQRRAPKGEVGGGTAADLPVLQDVAEFEFIDQKGQPFAKGDLAGKVWIADFIFTRCAGPCPMMTSRMSILQEEADPRVRLVSVSVDPEYDTVEVLAAYAKAAEAKEGRWWFLTGDKRKIYDFSIDSLKLTVAPTEKETQIIHSTRFVLVDKKGRVRGYYSGADAASLDDVEQLKQDALLLLAEEM